MNQNGFMHLNRNLNDAIERSLDDMQLGNVLLRNRAEVERQLGNRAVNRRELFVQIFGTWGFNRQILDTASSIERDMMILQEALDLNTDDNANVVEAEIVLHQLNRWVSQDILRIIQEQQDDIENEDFNIIQDHLNNMRRDGSGRAT